MTTKTTSRLASGKIANSGKFWVVPTHGPRLTDRHDLLGPYRAEGSAGHVRDKYLDEGIACAVVDSDERPVIELSAHPEQQRANAQAAGLRALADTIEANPELAYLLRTSFSHMGSHLFDSEREKLTTFIRLMKASGAEITKDYTTNYAMVAAKFGPVNVVLQADREQVCERVVVGTREVTEEVPDPEALAAVPTTTVTRVEDVVEWQCRPLLATEAAQS